MKKYRQVMFKEWISTERIEVPGGSQVVPGTGCYIEGYTLKGVFHKWINMNEVICALIENEHGEVVPIEINNIKFVPAAMSLAEKSPAISTKGLKIYDIQYYDGALSPDLIHYTLEALNGEQAREMFTSLFPKVAIKRIVYLHVL